MKGVTKADPWRFVISFPHSSFPASEVVETVILPERFAQDFAEGVKNRGREYFRGGEVRILRADARGILARVRGNALYKVEFDFYEDGDWQGECSCPFNQDR